MEACAQCVCLALFSGDACLVRALDVSCHLSLHLEQRVDVFNKIQEDTNGAMLCLHVYSSEYFLVYCLFS